MVAVAVVVVVVSAVAWAMANYIHVPPGSPEVPKLDVTVQHLWTCFGSKSQERNLNWEACDFEPKGMAWCPGTFCLESSKKH